MTVRINRDIEAAFATIMERGATAAIIGDSPIIDNQMDKILELVELYKIPAIYPEAKYVIRGGLLSYGASGAGAVEWRQIGAQYVGRILKGEKPADLPV